MRYFCLEKQFFVRRLKKRKSEPYRQGNLTCGQSFIKFGSEEVVEKAFIRFETKNKK